MQPSQAHLIVKAETQEEALERLEENITVDYEVILVEEATEVVVTEENDDIPDPTSGTKH